MGDVWACRWPDISIHALLAESDPQIKMMGAPVDNFYPRSPCGERLNSSYGALDGASISIHALLAESDENSTVGRFTPLEISIHALLAESDMLWPVHLARGLDFYPRSPCGERLLQNYPYGKRNDFYPRSPCGERHGSCRRRLSE